MVNLSYVYLCKKVTDSASNLASRKLDIWKHEKFRWQSQEKQHHICEVNAGLTHVLGENAHVQEPQAVFTNFRNDEN